MWHRSLYIIMQISSIETRSTAYNMQDKLSILDTYISTVNFDIDKYNNYAKVNC